MSEIPCREAARWFMDWALVEGIAEGGTPTIGNLSDLRGAVSPSGDEAKAILRKKRIVHVGFNTASGTITAYLRQAAPVSEKMLKVLPADVFGFPVLYKQGVPNSIELPFAHPHSVPSYSLRHTTKGPAITCGSSISVGNSRDAGTLGALVKDAAGGLFGLSNNHVVGSCNHAGVGLPIVFPGIADVVPGGIDPMTIGHFHRLLDMNVGDPSIVNAANNHDAAIFKIKNPQFVSSMQGSFYDTPAQTGPIDAGMKVEKVGRSTGHTSGLVTDELLGPFPINYKAPLYDFSGRVHYTPIYAIRGDNDAFSDFGDSGSLVVSTGSDGVRRAVGLLVGGLKADAAPGGSITLVLPLENALQALGVSLVSAHNV